MCAIGICDMALRWREVYNLVHKSSSQYQGISHKLPAAAAAAAQTRTYIMLGHTPQCSGVSTQVLAECTPALAGEGRKNQSLLVPNVLERAEERRSTLEGVSESRTGRGERPRPPAVRTASRKGSNDQLQIGLGCAERRRVGRDRRAARARREHRSAAGAVPLTWLCRAGQCLNDHIAGAVSTAIAATARWRASAPARLKLQT